MKGKKLVFLILALILPVAIFVFLKIFGKNQFDVPVLHQQKDFNPPADCNLVYQAPYRVADSVRTRLKLNDNDSLFVFYFDEAAETGMNRIAVEFKDDPVQLISSSDLPQSINPQFLKDCILLMHRDTSVALVDQESRIRGYYDGSDRDDVDRLIVEMKIILKQY